MNEKIFEAIKRASVLLEEKGLETNMSSLLMEFVTKKSSVSLLVDWHDRLTDEQQQQFWSQMHELLSGKPLQYVIGQESFYGRLFKVDANVLIPRPETEELVFEALKRCRMLFHDQVISVVDIGTGSGAIAVSFKKEWPEANVYGTDISEGALAIAKQNAEALDADISFRQGDMTAPIADQKWDVVLSNPPYIAYNEAHQMTNSVLDHEPHRALFAKDDGLYFYQQLANTLPPLMNKRSLIGVEIGYQQGEAVHKLFQQAFPNAVVDIVKDINGKDRMIFCKTCE